MLIKAQNNVIVNTKYGSVIENGHECRSNVINFISYGLGDYFLGEYKTEERANEVFNEIWELLGRKNINSETNEELCYEMPEE